MAQLPTVYAPTVAQVTAATRSMSSSKSMAPSRVASLDGRVEEASQGLTTTNLDMAPFALQREPQHHSPRDRHSPPRRMELLVVPSKSFSSLLEYHSENSFNRHNPEHINRKLGGIISHAIKLYELNAKVIHGEPEVPGTAISLTL